MSPPRALTLSAPYSGGGKTILTLGLLRAFADRGVAVSGAKSGPDYIDPAFHAAAARAPSVNLDAWAMRPETLRAAAAARTGELLLIEGAMGLLDGPPARADAALGAPSPTVAGPGSTARLAAALGAPVVLIVDVAHQAQSAALAAAGARALAPELEIAGLILNRTGSPRHARIARTAVEAAGFRVFGAVPREEALSTPSRHLGLVQAEERPDLERFVAEAARIVAACLDLDALAAAARPIRRAEVAPSALSPPPALSPPLGARIALARDEAFAFAYPHLIDGWRSAGAEIAPFSPLADEAPDPAADAIFLPGGYPELHAGRLAAAERFRAGTRAAADRGAAVYGECGGYMALGDALIDADGAAHPMLGLLPLETSFQKRRLTLGYRELRPIPRTAPRIPALDAPLAAHEFHYATILSEGAADRLFEAFDAEGAPLGQIGLRKGSVAGSFAHVIGPWPDQNRRP